MGFPHHFHRAFRRIFAAFLALVTISTQCIFLHAAEINFWADRQRMVHTALPAGSMDLPALSPVLNLSRRLGQNVVSNPTRPTVYYIQDIHLNAEAQSDISGLIAALVTEKNAALVAVEGAFAPIDLGFFRHAFNPNSLRLAAEALLFENKISGSLHAALTASSSAFPPVIGVDDRSSHGSNVEAYREAVLLKPSVQARLARQSEQLRKLQRRFWNATLRTFDAVVERNEKNQAPFGTYVEAVFTGDHNHYPNTARFLTALSLERRLDFGRVESERGRLLSALAAKLSAPQMRSLVDFTAAYRTGAITHHDFYGYLQRLCSDMGISLSRYPLMDDYLSYVSESERIDGDALFAELRDQERERYAALALTEAERRLVAETRQLRLKEKLTGFALTRDEWNAYKKFQENPLPQSLSPEGRGDLKPFEDFYRMAEIRDAKMAENFLKAARGLRSAVLVTGGFHSSGITRRLKAAGFDVVPVQPKIKTADGVDGSAYLSVFAREKSPLEKLFQGKRLFLSPEIDTPAIRTMLTAETAAAQVLDGPPAGRLHVDGPDGVAIDAEKNGDRTVTGRGNNRDTGRSVTFEAEALNSKPGLRVTFYDDAGLVERFVEGWARSVKELLLSFNPKRFVLAHDNEWWLDWVINIGGITLMWLAMAAAPFALVYYGYAAIPLWGLIPLALASIPVGNVLMHALLNTILAPLSMVLPVKLLMATDVPVKSEGGAPAGWRWPKPTDQELRDAETALAALFEETDGKKSVSFGLYFIHLFSSVPSHKASAEVRALAVRKKAVPTLRAIFYSHPEMAEMIMMTFFNHIDWSEIITQTSPTLPPIEPDIFGAMLDLGLKKYSELAAGRDDVNTGTTLLAPRPVTTVEFGGKQVEVQYSLRGIGGLFGYIKNEVFAEEIIAQVHDDELPVLIKGMIYFAQFDGSVAPENRQRIVDHLKRIPADRMDRIREKLQAEVQVSLKKLDVLVEEAPLPPNATVPMTGHPGIGIGYLKIVNENYPDIDKLREFQRTHIVALRGLPTAETFGPCAGLITTEEPMITGHAPARARAWGAPHGVLPSLDPIRQYEDKLVVLETVHNEVTVRLATEVEEREFLATLSQDTPKHIEIPIVADVEELVLGAHDGRAFNPAVVGYKVALLNQLALMGLDIEVPGVKVQFGLGPTIPMSTFRKLLVKLGDAAEHRYALSINDLDPKYEFRDQELEKFLAAIRKLVNKFDLNDLWESFLAHGGEALLARGVFLRGGTNTDSLPDHPGIGAGMIATVPHVKDKDTFLRGVRTVLASAWMFDAYWERRMFGIDQALVFPSIWIVPSEPADFAGVLHTSNVSASRLDQFLVELTQGQGIGSSLVDDGMEDMTGRPAVVLVNKKDLRIIEEKEGVLKKRLVFNGASGFKVEESEESADFVRINPADKKKLLEAFKKISELVEWFIGRPQEIELVVKKHGTEWIITILQVRSVGLPFKEDRSDMGKAPWELLSLISFLPLVLPMLMGAGGGNIAHLGIYYAALAVGYLFVFRRIFARWLRHLFVSKEKLVAQSLAVAYDSANTKRPDKFGEALSESLTGAPLNMDVMSGPRRGIQPNEERLNSQTLIEAIQAEALRRGQRRLGRSDSPRNVLDQTMPSRRRRTSAA